jgi:endo-1,4-beta-xylanase
MKTTVLALAACAVLAGQPLRDLATQRAIRIGAAVDPTRFSETAYADTLAREFNQVEPENAMKFGPIHPGPNTYAFSPPDAIVSFAKAHNMAVRGHTMVWHSQNPTWLTNGNYSPAQLSAILQDHIATVMGRYAGQVYAWDVVNEAFDDSAKLRSTIWYDSPGIGFTGTGYIEQALGWARAADANALLFYNDYNIETLNAKSDAVYGMVKDFLARGVPIDGVGLQAHFTASAPSFASMESNIRRFTDLGLQVHITEFDVRLPVDTAGNATVASLATQAQIYGNTMTVCLKFALCTAFQTWGFTDKYSWIPGTFSGFGAGLEFDAAYRTKPSYDSMTSALSSAPPVISAAGLVNAASYAGGAVAPGEIVALFGATFGPASLQSTASGVRILFDGVAAPLLYTQVGQTGAMVPFGVAGKTATQVQYEYQGIQSNTVTVPVRDAVPGLFTLDSSGKGAGAILDTAYRVISKNNPARRGDVVLLYGTGGGTAGPDGLLTAKASVTIGGVDCPVLYAGSAPGLIAGAVQVNVQVASGVPSGEQPVVLTMGTASSQPGVIITVQ